MGERGLGDRGRVGAGGAALEVDRSHALAARLPPAPEERLHRHLRHQLRGRHGLPCGRGK